MTLTLQNRTTAELDVTYQWEGYREGCKTLTKGRALLFDVKGTYGEREPERESAALTLKVSRRIEGFFLPGSFQQSPPCLADKFIVRGESTIKLTDVIESIRITGNGFNPDWNPNIAPYQTNVEFINCKSAEESVTK